MERFTVLMIALLFSIQGFAQDRLFVLHPLVGDSINKSEKLNYLLFPQIPDSGFVCATITHKGNEYLVRSNFRDQSFTFTTIDSLEIAQYIANLDKLMEYYSKKEKKETKEESIKLKPDLMESEPGSSSNLQIDRNTKTKISEEARTSARMKEDAERLQQIRQGNDITGGAYIELFPSKKKKKR